ncbi:hypothetical protein TNCV_5123411 [Trichonephila clavipes]|nr:hypothetical protein TNCV_5123411 [Trichonephila clavipes]
MQYQEGIVRKLYEFQDDSCISKGYQTATPISTVQADRQFYEGHCDWIEKGRTITRRFVAGGLHSWFPLRIQPLISLHGRLSSQYCRSRAIWMTSEWGQVLRRNHAFVCPMIGTDVVTGSIQQLLRNTPLNDNGGIIV